MVPGFPLPVRPDGSCSKLENNLCTVYEARPDVCRIGYARARLGLSEDDYARLTAHICNRLQVADGMPESYRVKID